MVNELRGKVLATERDVILLLQSIQQISSDTTNNKVVSVEEHIDTLKRIFNDTFVFYRLDPIDDFDPLTGLPNNDIGNVYDMAVTPDNSTFYKNPLTGKWELTEQGGVSNLQLTSKVDEVAPDNLDGVIGDITISPNGKIWQKTGSGWQLKYVHSTQTTEVDSVLNNSDGRVGDLIFNKGEVFQKVVVPATSTTLETSEWVTRGDLSITYINLERPFDGLFGDVASDVNWMNYTKIFNEAEGF